MERDIAVAAAAVAVPDENETLVAPEPGDVVTVTIEGRVSRVDGEVVYVAPELANGEPMPAHQEEATGTEGDLDREGRHLRRDLESLADSASGGIYA